MNLSPKEKTRYQRHLILDQIGEKGQLNLKKAKILMVGAGGLGCPILQYLTAAGVGTIGIVDFDKVEVSNLQRQILYTTNDVGTLKVEAAKQHLLNLNPFTNIITYPTALSCKNVLTIFKDYDVIIDGTDNFSTRYLVNDACVKLDKPFVYGSIFKFEGQVAVFNYKDGPTYRCLYPTPPKAGTVPSCSEIGVIGVLPGIIGLMQANEALKIVLNLGDVLSGQLLIYDALKTESLKINITKNNQDVLKIKHNDFNIEEQNYQWFCGEHKSTENNQISASKFETFLNNPLYQIIDVRESWETPELKASNVKQIPLDEIDDRIDEISKQKQVIVVCQTGGRSAHVITYLKANYDFLSLQNLEGGLNGL